MICAIILKCFVLFHIAVAGPLDIENINKFFNEENVRMASPSYIRSAESPTSESLIDHNIFNVPIPDLDSKVRPNIRLPQVPAKSNLQWNLQNEIISEINKIKQRQSQINQAKNNLNQIETKYLQNPYENINTLRSPQLQQTSSEIYENINRQAGNIPPPTIQRWQKLYQGSSTLQKLLSNPSLIQNIFAPKPQKKQFILVYPNGTIGYADNIHAVSNKYPNHIILSSKELQKLTNIESENQAPVKTQQKHEVNGSPNLVISTTNINLQNNPVNFNPEKSDSDGYKSVTDLHNKYETTAEEASINRITDRTTIVSQNTPTDNISSKISKLNPHDNLEHVVTTTTTITDDNFSNLSSTIEVSNDQVDINPITPSPDNSEHIPYDRIRNTTSTENTSQEYPQITTTANKIDELINANNTTQSDTKYDFHTESVSSTVTEKSSNTENLHTDSSNDLNYSQYTTKIFGATTAIPTDIENISKDDTQTTTAYNDQAVINNIDNFETITTDLPTVYDHNDIELNGTITDIELIIEENADDYSEEDFIKNAPGFEIVNNTNEINSKLDGTDTLSWITFNKEDAQKILFGDGQDNPNIYFIFYNPPEADLEKETNTSTYPNGTVVEEYIEIRKMPDGTTLKTSTVKTYNTSSVNNTGDNK